MYVCLIRNSMAAKGGSELRHWVVPSPSSLIQRAAIAPADAARDTGRRRYPAPGAGHALRRSRDANLGRLQAHGIALDCHIGIELGRLKADVGARLVLLDVRFPTAHEARGLGLDGTGAHLVAVHQDGRLLGRCIHLGHLGRQARLPAIPLQALGGNLGLGLGNRHPGALGLGADKGAIGLHLGFIGILLDGLALGARLVELHLGSLGVEGRHKGADRFAAGLNAGLLQTDRLSPWKVWALSCPVRPHFYGPQPCRAKARHKPTHIPVPSLHGPGDAEGSASSTSRRKNASPRLGSPDTRREMLTVAFIRLGRVEEGNPSNRW